MWYNGRMIDLHIHSNRSDGSDTPEEIVRKGAALGLRAMALTDHDTVRGSLEFLETARNLGVETVPAVELSVRFESGEVHVLGYGIDPRNPDLTAGLEFFRSARLDRNRKMVEQLARVGYPVTFDEVVACAGDPELVGRPHFAEALRRRGYVKTTAEAFDRLIGDHGPGYVPRRFMDAAEGVRLVREAGGIPVWAHPRLGFSNDSIVKILGKLVPKGLAGLEAYHAEHTPRKREDVAAIARGRGLLVTGGTDYHGKLKPGLALGTGFGDLSVPDELWDSLRSSMKSAK